MALGFIGGTIDHAKRLVDLYRTAGRDAGHPRSSSPSPSPATSTSERPKSMRWATSARTTTATSHRRPTAGRGWHVDRPTMTSLTARGGALMAGGPTQIAEKILDLHAELGVDRFLGQVDLGGMPQQMVRDSIQRFSDIVAPAVRHILTREQEHQPA
jgi:alkanesulfonate monooxygenase SsuD/methylene tetrahydromethanopterin reductase-like flavin-dependent oxidoreductase (luciferase family)